MASFEIQNFRPGLDTRRYELTSVPGSLETLVNAHINQGGEIEVRKTIAVITSAQFVSTFGAQETATGIVVFGTATVGALPTGFSYQKLTHPAVLAGTAYDPAKHAMTGVVCSCLFGAYAFVVATFTDGTTWAYYNGALVNDFTAGIILAYLAGSNISIATNIKNQLALTSQYAASTVTGSNVDVFGPIGAQYTVSIVETSAAGTMTAQIKNQGLSSLPGTQAVGQFQIVAGAAGTNNLISVVKLTGGGGQAATNLLYNSVAINWQTTTGDTAITVANSISQYAPTTGYYAIASANTVLIYAVAVGTSTNNLGLSVTVNNPTTANNYNICIGNCAIGFSGAGNAGAFAVTQIAAGATNLLAGTVSTASLALMVPAIAVAINNHNVGYAACALGTTLYISKVVTTSADAPITVTVTTGTGVTAGTSSQGGATISLSASIVSGSVVRHHASNNDKNPLYFTSITGSYILAPVSVILGGVLNSPYTYQWNLVSVNNGISGPYALSTNFFPLTAASKTSATIALDTTLLANLVNYAYLLSGAVSTTYNCTVTDAASVAVTTADVTFTVSIQTTAP